MRHPTFLGNLRHRDEKSVQEHTRDRLYHYADTVYGAMGQLVSDLD